ncbi:hypothetical protein AGMMS49942_28640 [Spirochaetia bacterium]|nr:hypothetical protein AGMMS49942_28640 [Spirochaetia bacterium]
MADSLISLQYTTDCCGLQLSKVIEDEFMSNMRFLSMQELSTATGKIKEMLSEDVKIVTKVSL